MKELYHMILIRSYSHELRFWEHEHSNDVTFHIFIFHVVVVVVVWPFTWISITSKNMKSRLIFVHRVENDLNKKRFVRLAQPYYIFWQSRAKKYYSNPSLGICTVKYSRKKLISFVWQSSPPARITAYTILYLDLTTFLILTLDITIFKNSKCQDKTDYFMQKFSVWYLSHIFGCPLKDHKFNARHMDDEAYITLWENDNSKVFLSYYQTY